MTEFDSRPTSKLSRFLAVPNSVVIWEENLWANLQIFLFLHLKLESWKCLAGAWLQMKTTATTPKAIMSEAAISQGKKNRRLFLQSTAITMLAVEGYFHDRAEGFKLLKWWRPFWKYQASCPSRSLPALTSRAATQCVWASECTHLQLWKSDCSRLLCCSDLFCLLLF